jgi:hypothetical protein
MSLAAPNCPRLFKERIKITSSSSSSSSSSILPFLACFYASYPEKEERGKTEELIHFVLSELYTSGNAKRRAPKKC